MPRLWLRDCYPVHDTMSSFVENLADRYSYIISLLQAAAGDEVMSRKFWLPGFYSQRNLLTTLMQEVARKQHFTIESLVINYRIMGAGERMYSQVKAEGTNTYYIEGLFIYGAEWDE